MHKMTCCTGRLAPTENRRRLLRNLPPAATFADYMALGQSTMTDDGTVAAGAASDTRNADTKLYDASGEPLQSRGSPGQADQLAEFVKQQPFTAALVALVVGYLLGKVT